MEAQGEKDIPQRFALAVPHAAPPLLPCLCSRSDEPLGTLVQAFNGQDDSDAPGPSGLSDMHTAERVPVAWEVETKQLVAAGMRDEAMRRAAPSHGLIRCYVKRCKSLFGHTTYAMYLEAGDMFLLAARRRKKSKASTYVISQDPEDLKRDTENCVAKVGQGDASGQLRV